MKGIEIVNLIAAIMIIIAAIPKNQLLFRILNGIGSILLVVYGSLLVKQTGYTGYSTIVLNSICFILAVYHIIRILKGRKAAKKSGNLDSYDDNLKK